MRASSSSEAIPRARISCSDSDSKDRFEDLKNRASMDISQAVNAPRLHHQWQPDKVFLEPYALSPDTEKTLAAMKFTAVPLKRAGSTEAVLMLKPSA